MKKDMEKQENTRGSRHDSKDSKTSGQVVAGRPGRSTGPVTAPGKKRASKNALKHGIFSKVVVLAGESRSSYEELLDGLQDYWQPEGKMEDLLVEKLSVLFWRYKRLTQAEAAEIHKVTEFLGQSLREQDLRVAEESEIWGELGKGMLHQATNPCIYERAIYLLLGLRWKLAERGANFEEDIDLLKKLYGLPVDGELPYRYLREYAAIAFVVGKKGASVDEAAHNLELTKKIAVRDIDREIRRLEELQETYKEIAEKRKEYTAQASGIPSEGTMNRLMRYEANLERFLDRTMTQLERLQRMRAGQAIPPPLKIEVSKG